MLNCLHSEWASWNGHLYYFSSDEGNIFEAKDECRDLQAGLLKIENNAENTFIKNQIRYYRLNMMII